MTPLIPPDWQVPAIFRNRLGKSAGRQRAMFADGHLLLILHELPRPRRIHREARLFWRDPHGRWRAAPGDAAGTPPLYAHLDQFAQGIEKLEEQTDHAADAETYYHVLKAVAPIHRTAMYLHHTLQEARETVRDDRDLILLRDRAGEIERAAELLHADARNGLDFTVARRAEEQAATGQRLVHASNRLNLLAAVFLPVTAVGAAFSMRIDHGLDELPSPWTFWIVLAAAVTVGLLLRTAFAPAPTRIERPPREPWRQSKDDEALTD